MSAPPDVAIIGGGIIGLTSALFLAREGLSVAVYDRADLGREASWAGAGIIPPGNPDRAATPIDKLRGIGSARFPAFSEELRDLTGIDNGYRRCGGIEFLPPEDAEVPGLWRAEGIACERLTLDAAKKLEPLGDVEGEPYLLPDCAQVRNPWQLRALVAACEKLGVKLHTQAAVDRFWYDGKNTSLRMKSGDFVSAGNYLLAAGAWSEELIGTLFCFPDIHPVRGQIALLRGESCSRVLMFGKRYLVPRGDGLTLVGSTEEPEAGFEKQTTAEAIDGLLDFARRVVPRLANATLETSWAGLRPGTPDGLPFIGKVPSSGNNVFVAAGHFRAGVQLSIGTAQVVSELVTGKPTSVPLEAFSLLREPVTSVKRAFRS